MRRRPNNSSLNQGGQKVHALIIADLEGITDVYDLTDTGGCAALYTAEIQQYIQALLSRNVAKITVCDAHDKGNLISREISSDNVNIVARVDNFPFDEKYDFAILAGFHGMNGSPGIIPHTLRYDFKAVFSYYSRLQTWIPIGEVEIYSRWLGAKGIPVILVTGDREAVYEANCFNPYRQTCCVKSCFELNPANRALVYAKIAHSLDSALKLNRYACLSEDSSEIAVEFNNPDVAEELSKAGYTSKEGRIVFSSCTELVNGLYPLLDKLNEINRANIAINKAFISEVRKLVGPLKKEDVANSAIGPLLNKNILFLDSKSREKIMEGIKAMLDNLPAQQNSV